MAWFHAKTTLWHDFIAKTALWHDFIAKTALWHDFIAKTALWHSSKGVGIAQLVDRWTHDQ